MPAPPGGFGAFSATTRFQNKGGTMPRAKKQAESTVAEIDAVMDTSAEVAETNGVEPVLSTWENAVIESDATQEAPPAEADTIAAESTADGVATAKPAAKARKPRTTTKRVKGAGVTRVED